MSPTRAEVEARLQALLADHLDHIAKQNPEGFDIGVAAIVTEVRYPAEVEDIEAIIRGRPRPEALYTPAAEWRQYVSFVCSDSRAWIQYGLLRAALEVLADDGDEDEDE
jgi:hypothetical protein